MALTTGLPDGVESTEVLLFRGLSRGALVRGILRKIRGAIGNALVWGVTWFGASAALVSAWVVAGPGSLAGSWANFILPIAVNAGAVGFIVGGGFSALLGTVYRRRRLEDIRVSRAALAGAGISGLISTFIDIAVIGGPTSVGFVATGFVLAALLGGATAGGTLRVAQLPSGALEVEDSHDLVEGEDRAVATIGRRAI